MIKFRCPNCGQKIAVNDEGAGVVISCPTCVITIVVPSETQAEFRQPIPSQTSASLVPVEKLVVEQRQEGSAALLRAELRPHLARLMMDKLVRALFSQRAHLLETQQASTACVAELEQRLMKVQEQLQARLNAYERRIADLDKQLVAAQEENRELVRARFQLARKVLELEQKQRTRVDLRDAGFLLGA